MEKVYTIYKISNVENNKVYVGVTDGTAESRFAGHKSKAKCGSQSPLYRAMLELGFDKFSVTPVEVTMDVERAKELEQKYIKLFNSNDPKFGYNNTSGGEYTIITEAHRLAMSEGQKGCVKMRLRKGVLQYSHDGDFIQEFSGMTEASKATGVPRASILRSLNKTIKRGSKANPYIWVWASQYGDIPSHVDPATVYTDLNFKSKFSEKCISERKKYETKTGNLYELSKPVIKYSTSWEKLEEYPSISEAARANGMSPEALRRHFRGDYDYTNPKILKRLKYIWKLKEDVA